MDETIRISMLPTVLDCTRRAAANQFSKLIDDAGYKLNERTTGIYTILGTGTDAAINNMLTHKIKTGDLPSPENSIEAGVSKFEEEIKDAESIIYDDTTSNQDAAKFQIDRFVKFYQRDIAPRLAFPGNADPKDHIQKKVEMRLSGYQITGHIDLITLYSICDTKTGKALRAYHSQLGGYANLEVGQGGKKPKYLIVHYLPRVNWRKSYPGTKIQLYDVEFSINESWYAINQIIRDLNNFKDTTNPACFPANPQSTLCARKYCRAYGTNFCKYHRGG